MQFNEHLTVRAGAENDDFTVAVCLDNPAAVQQAGRISRLQKPAQVDSVYQSTNMRTRDHFGLIADICHASNGSLNPGY